jgi:hypothetical protein
MRLTQLFLFLDGKLGKPEDSIATICGETITFNLNKVEKLFHSYVYVDLPKCRCAAPEGMSEEEYMDKTLTKEEIEQVSEMDCPDMKPFVENDDPIMDRFYKAWEAHGFPGVPIRDSVYMIGRGQIWCRVKNIMEFQWPEQFCDIHYENKAAVL